MEGVSGRTTAASPSARHASPGRRPLQSGVPAPIIIITLQGEPGPATHWQPNPGPPGRDDTAVTSAKH